MALPLHDVVVGTYAQILTSTAGVLAKGRAHCEENGIGLDEVIGRRLRDDMAPLHFQVVSVWHHSLGALKGVQAGEFGPPPSIERDYAGLQELVEEARAGLAAFDVTTLDALESKDVVFRLGGNELPFVAKDFLLSFSLPNFYFHATTAYDILRAEGAPLGKRDFLGAIRLKTG